MQYKTVLFTLSLLLFFASCTKNSIYGDIYDDIPTCESGSNGLLLDKIDYEYADGTLRQYEYIYDKTNQLESINAKAKAEILVSYKFSYDIMKRVVEQQTFSMLNGLLKKSSVNGFVYDSKNRIIEIKYFYIDTLNSLVLNQITKFTYDKNDRIETSVHLTKDYKDTINNKIDEVSRITKYYWDENNLIGQEDFSKNRVLLHEWSYKYDKMKNSSQKIPTFYSPFKLQNTQISFSVVDHTGLLDLLVAPKIIMLCYNTEGFLTKIVREKGGASYFYRNP